MEAMQKELAKKLINYSCSLKKGEKVLIEVKGTDGLPLAKMLIKEAYEIGAIPVVNILENSIDRELLLNVTEEQLKIMAEADVLRMKQMDAYIGIRAAQNVYELADVPQEKIDLHTKLYVQPVHFDVRLTKKWVILRYPNQSMAQMSHMSTEAFANHYYSVCNLDYAKMSEAFEPLKKLMERTDKVHIKGKGTDLTFSIKNMGVVKCVGLCNIPDGEIYTAPVKDSVNGVITYNVPSEHNGFVYTDVTFEFNNGKIVYASSNNSERINKVLDTDEGARYIGEFAIGVNPHITTPMNDTLFDEKIMGSFHFTPGNCYEDADNGNKSTLHWDLVCIQTKEYGGGEIYFDDVLIRKDGIFVLDELKCLNPENLK